MHVLFSIASIYIYIYIMWPNNCVSRFIIASRVPGGFAGNMGGVCALAVRCCYGVASCECHVTS